MKMNFSLGKLNSHKLSVLIRNENSVPTKILGKIYDPLENLTILNPTLPKVVLSSDS